MANIKNMEIARVLSKQGVLNIKSGFLGFGCKATMNENGAEIKGRVLEYGPVDGERLQYILRKDTPQMVRELCDGRFECHGTGNARLEILQTADGQKLWIQLFRFVNLEYSPVSDIILLQDDAARSVASAL